MNAQIRPYKSSDLEELKRITIDAFDGIALDQMVDEALDMTGESDWRQRKARHIDEDVAANQEGIFVAVQDQRIIGYITTVLDPETRKGRIPNLAVGADSREKGLGRKLIEHAVDYLRSKGMRFVMIETMAANEVGNHLYPSCGFVEVARQVHFAMRL